MHGTTDDADPDQETGLTAHGEIRHHPAARPNDSDPPAAVAVAPRFARDVAVETIGALLAIALAALVVALVTLL